MHCWKRCIVSDSRLSSVQDWVKRKQKAEREREMDDLVEHSVNDLGLQSQRAPVRAVGYRAAKLVDLHGIFEVNISLSLSLYAHTQCIALMTFRTTVT